MPKIMKGLSGQDKLNSVLGALGLGGNAPAPNPQKGNLTQVPVGTPGTQTGGPVKSRATPPPGSMTGNTTTGYAGADQDGSQNFCPDCGMPLGQKGPTNVSEDTQDQAQPAEDK